MTRFNRVSNVLHKFHAMDVKKNSHNFCHYKGLKEKHGQTKIYIVYDLKDNYFKLTKEGHLKNTRKELQ